MNQEQNVSIKAIIGLGNPGREYEKTRHNIGFRVIDSFVEKYGAGQPLRVQDQLMTGKIALTDGRLIVVVKPMTFMNASGKAMPFLKKQGIKPEEVVVVHDELEFPFGKVGVRLGGSARGHNGLKSLIEQAGGDFWRIRCGIDRPESREDVSRYVLSPFSENAQAVETLIEAAVKQLEMILKI